MVQLGPDARRLLDGANYGHLSTLMPGGQPKAEPVWVARDDDRVLVATDGKSIKTANVRADPRVALSLCTFDDPYEQLLIRGQVVEIRPDADLEVLDAMSHCYLGTPFPRRRWSERVVLVIEADLARHYRSALRDPRSTTTTTTGVSPVDQLAIATVLHRYADACDHKDYALLSEVFTDDGVARYGPNHLIEGGPGAIGAFIAEMLDTCGPTQHLLGNVEVSIESDITRSVCRIRALHVGAGEHAGETFEVFGEYHDQLVSTTDGWRITRREMVNHGQIGSRAVLGG